MPEITPNTAVVIALLALAGTIITAVLTRRSTRETNQIAARATDTSGWSQLLAGQASELQRLTQRVTQVEKQVVHEREARHRLAEVLRSAWGHIMRLGEQVRALGGDPEPPPAELTAWTHNAGLVVDSVETTIRRTVVTDPRDPDSPPLDQTEVSMDEIEDTRERD